MTKVEQLRVMDGPSREELFDALRLRHEQRTIVFKLKHPGAPGVLRPMSAIIIGITAESDNGHYWNVTGTFVTPGHIAPFDMFYRTNDRNGILNT